MSTLTENLQTIYEVKQQLKQVIGTSSDIFEDYPSYISNMVTPTGTINISENGTTNVSTYAYAYVSVNGGGTTPTGAYNITVNGNYDVTTYEYAYVAVPISPSDGSNLITAPVDSSASETTDGQYISGIPHGTVTFSGVNLVGGDGIVVNNFGASFENYQAIETQVYDGDTYTYWQHSDMFTATHTTVNDVDAFTFVNQFTDSNHALRFRLYCAYNYYDEFIDNYVTGEAWTTWVRIVNIAGEE